jgi:pantoate--beta-alanine ligase
VRSAAEMAAITESDLGFVPTMGAFHEGHLSLMREARKIHDCLCVSLFVNPLQFGKSEDLDKYPRNEERDFAMAGEVGVDILFAPAANEIYPRESTIVHVPEITDLWEGSLRPGHFDGVATVVLKLFNLVKPRTAYFGWKDLQQCLVIRRMVEDLNVPVSLSFLPTVREADGLAMSSRNVYLSPEDRARAPKLRQTLIALAKALSVEDRSVASELEVARKTLVGQGFRLDYLELVSLNDIRSTLDTKNAALIVAARLGATRLIDNLRLGADVI